MAACRFDLQGHEESPNVLLDVRTGPGLRGKKGQIKCMGINKVLF